MLRFLSGAFFMPRQDFERMVMQEGIALNCFALSILLLVHFVRCKNVIISTKFVVFFVVRCYNVFVL